MILSLVLLICNVLFVCAVILLAKQKIKETTLYYYKSHIFISDMVKTSIDLTLLDMQMSDSDQEKFWVLFNDSWMETKRSTMKAAGVPDSMISNLTQKEANANTH